MTSGIIVERPETDTRARIMATAERFFREIGYQKTTVADIAKALKMSPANVYRFFDSKKAINEAVAERLMGEVEAAIEEILGRRASAVDKLRAFITTMHMMNAERYTGDLKLHEMVEVAMTESWDVIHRHLERVLAALHHIIVEGVEAGEFHVADPHRAAFCVKTSLMRFFHPQLIVQCAREPGPSLDEMTAFVLRALGHKG